jgi:ABC-type protease/lipase transport system fused ATPase/permease subunit
MAPAGSRFLEARRRWPVELDGRAPDRWRADERALRVGYLPQEPGLFAGTVRENIGLADGDKPLLRKLIAAAGLARDVAEFPQGADTLVVREG